MYLRMSCHLGNQAHDFRVFQYEGNQLSTFWLSIMPPKLHSDLPKCFLKCNPSQFRTFISLKTIRLAFIWMKTPKSACVDKDKTIISIQTSTGLTCNRYSNYHWTITASSRTLWVRLPLLVVICSTLFFLGGHVLILTGSWAVLTILD